MDVYLVTASGVESRSVDELPALLERGDGIVWVDIPGCDDEAERVLLDVFKFHPLAVKDACERNRVPKLHAYSDHVFVVLHTPELGRRGHVHYIELDQFIGRHYLVTVHGPNNPAVDPDVGLRQTREALQRIEAGRLRPATPFELSHAIVSAMTRVQDEFVETMTKDVWQLEQRVTGGDVSDPEVFLTELFQTRHGLLAVRTMAALGDAIYDSMTHLSGMSLTGRRMVADNARQFDLVRSTADGELGYLHGVIEFYQTTLIVKSTLVGQRQNEEMQRISQASYVQNEDVKKISAWAAIFFAPSLIGTVYGMNFEHMPELGWTLGYPLALLVMVLTSVVLYVLFKRIKWL
jgi:Mg2+ and Co2+ transporter CorA